MKKRTMKAVIGGSLIAMMSVPAVNAAELKYTFGSIKAGYANWDMGLEDTNRGSLWKIVGDYGAAFDKGEFYSFYEYNRFDHPTDTRNVSLMASGHYRINQSDYTVFGKVYGSIENKWGDELNTMLGFGYLGWQGQQGFFKPFLAMHELSSDYTSATHGSANGNNGVVLGWTAAYNFKVAGENFALSNWNEFEIGRNDAYAEQQYSDFGINGGLTLTWKMAPHFSTNVTYRYFQDKLGYEGWGDQLIFLAGYHF
ncbi:MAG: outer membrane protein OmpK [Vibrio sp.]|uniref:outer membrane protein OmpK n=1 Tax=Vibrio sp. TaxID=678 RepID=UPI003A8A1A71